jgi:hypothetical protein
MHRRPSPQSPAKADPHRRCLSPHCTGAGLLTRRFVVGVIQRPSRCRANPGIRGTCAASCADLSAAAKPIVMRLRAQAALAKVVDASHSPHRGAGAPVSLNRCGCQAPKAFRARAQGLSRAPRHPRAKRTGGRASGRRSSARGRIFSGSAHVGAGRRCVATIDCIRLTPSYGAAQR